VALELERAVPFGLMLIELIANVCKQAFPEPRTGELRVRLHQNERHIELQVSDTGVGHTRPSYSRDGSFGLHLVQTLAPQLGGRLPLAPATGHR
jgi:two-component system, sensor histidine kinase PdtaS